MVTPPWLRLLEAERDTRKDRAVSPPESTLAEAMRKGFRAQERDLLARIARNRRLWFLEAALTEAVPPGEFDSLWDGVEDATSAAMAKAMQDAAEAGLVAGGQSAATDLALSASFDLRFPGAEAWLRDHGAARVAGINETTRAQLRALLVQGAEEGWSYSRTAREIRTRFTGFHTPNPALHVRDRAELIAITEVGEAYEQGRALMVDSLHAQGVSTEKRWLTSGDERVCPVCEPNGLAGWLGGLDVFPSGHSQPLGHPACRCDLLVRVAERVPVPA